MLSVFLSDDVADEVLEAAFYDTVVHEDIWYLF